MRFALVIATVAALAGGCQGRRDQLLASLQSVRPDERAAAVRRLADHARPEDLILFTRAARDPAPIVRGEAATALGYSQNPRVIEVLGELLGDPDGLVQGKAAMALAHTRTGEATSYLLLQYGRRGRSTRQAIIAALESANIPRAMAAAVAEESRSIWEHNLEALASGSLPEQVAAAEVIGQSGRAEAVDRLLPLINDPHVVLAAAAVRGLGYSGDPRAVRPIAELLAENFPELREAAMDALVRLGDIRALPRLKDIALERSAASGLATAAIIGLPEKPETGAALCDIALGAAPDEARTAAHAMRGRGGCALEPILHQLGRGGEPLSALYALEGLGKTAASAAPRMIPLVASPDAALRLQAIQTLAELGDVSAADAIHQAYEQEVKWLENDRARDRRNSTEIPAEKFRLLAATLRALGRLGAPDAFQILEAHTKDRSASVRSGAYVGLVAVGPKGIAAAREALSDRAAEVRAAAALALAERGAEGQAELVPTLAKPNSDRTAIFSALDHAGPTPAVADALLAVLAEGGADAAVAARLLGRLATREAVQPLLDLLDDPAAVGRREALLALGRIGDPAAADAVARDLSHESPDVRAAAAEALGLLGTSPPPEALDALRGDYYRQVRQSAEAALARIAKAPEGRAAK